MGTSRALLLALACASVSSAAGARTPAARALETLSDAGSKRILVIAHRSCWQQAPENSLAGVRACERLGVDGVELDVRHSRDGVAVIIHDETVDRTTNGHGKVTEMSWAELSALRLKERSGGQGARLTEERIPTLTQYLRAARNRLMIVFDVKDWSQASTFAAIGDAGMEKQAIFFYECNNDRLLDKVRAFRDRVVMIPIMFEKDGPLNDGARRCHSNPANWAHVKFESSGWLDHAKEISADQGLRLWTATMFPEDNAGLDDARAARKPDAVWGRQIASGARMIMTNTPQELVRYLHAKR